MNNIVKNKINKGILNNLCSKSQNIKILKELYIENKDKHENIIIGYEIQNIGNEPIKNILFINKKIDLQPNDILKLPTEWITLLLHRVHYGLKVKNGEFKLKRPNKNLAQYFAYSFDFVETGSIKKEKIAEIENNKIIILDSNFAYLKQSINIEVVTSAKFLANII